MQERLAPTAPSILVRRALKKAKAASRKKEGKKLLKGVFLPLLPHCFVYRYF